MEQLILDLIEKMEIQKKDPWNKLGDSICIPIKVLDILIKEIQHYKNLSRNFNTDKSQEVIVFRILEIIDNYSHHITTIQDDVLGVGMQKSIAAHEIAKEIKKNFPPTNPEELNQNN